MIEDNVSIVLIGPQHVGKSTVGELLSQLLDVPFLDSDTLILSTHMPTGKTFLNIRELYKIKGKEKFQQLESDVYRTISPPFILATGGGLASNTQAIANLAKHHPKILLSSTPDIVWERIIKTGVPSYISHKSILDMTNEELQLAQETFHKIFIERMHVYQEIADMTIDTLHKSSSAIANEVYDRLSNNRE